MITDSDKSILDNYLADKIYDLFAQDPDISQCELLAIAATVCFIDLYGVQKGERDVENMLMHGSVEMFVCVADIFATEPCT